MLINGKIVSMKQLLAETSDDIDILIVGKDIPIECVDLNTHSYLTKDFATLVGIINWELIRSGRIAIDDFEQFSNNKCSSDHDKLFGKLMVSINRFSGKLLPDDYHKEYDNVEKAKWLTKDMRIMLSNLLMKIALNPTLKLVKVV